MPKEVFSSYSIKNYRDSTEFLVLCFWNCRAVGRKCFYWLRLIFSKQSLRDFQLNDRIYRKRFH